MKSKIDEIDRKILESLREDARMQAAEISRRLGSMTARAVRNRLDRLLEEGFIAIAAWAVPERLGFPISADIVVDVNPGMTKKVAQSLVELDEVSYVAITTGDSDISVSVVAANMGDLQTFITEKLHLIPGVQKTKTQIVTKELKKICNWSFPKQLPEV